MAIYNLCRICLVEDTNTKKMEPLFAKNKRCERIVKRIEECGGIVLKPHSEFPKMICSQCMDSLNTSYKFRSLCQASENAILEAIVKSAIKVEIQDQNSQMSDALCTEENDESCYDLHTNFVDAGQIKDNNDDIEEEDQIDPEADSENEYKPLDETESEFDEKEEKPKIKRKTVKERIKKETNGQGKRGRPRLKHINSETAEKALISTKKNVKSRGRKKVDVIEASIICEICGNIYLKKSLLNMHMRRHMATKPFNCEICGKSFACSSEVGRHMRSHTGEKPYVCKYCGRTFADRSTNIKHERIHTNERPFKCNTCGKSFTYSNVLKNHLLIHTGEKPFPCFCCNKTFSRKHQLDQHFSTLSHKQAMKNLTLKDEQEIIIQLN